MSASLRTTSDAVDSAGRNAFAVAFAAIASAYYRIGY